MIKISDGTKTITMPRTRDIQDAGELVYKETEMASGKRVRDIPKGKCFRPGFRATWDYLPRHIIKDLITMLRQGGYFDVEYPDPDGTIKTGKFSIDYPDPRIFAFRKDVAIWHGFTLLFKSQEVIRP